MNAYETLTSTGIPTYAGAWKETVERHEPPEAYISYTQMRTEDFHADDSVDDYRLYIYADLWSESDPTELATIVRNAMHAEGWGMDEERIDYVDEAKRFRASWTWVRSEDAENVDEN